MTGFEPATFTHPPPPDTVVRVAAVLDVGSAEPINDLRSQSRPLPPESSERPYGRTTAQ
jgi:hypothetical protein